MTARQIHATTSEHTPSAKPPVGMKKREQQPFKRDMATVRNGRLHERSKETNSHDKHLRSKHRPSLPGCAASSGAVSERRPLISGWTVSPEKNSRAYNKVKYRGVAAMPAKLQASMYLVGITRANTHSLYLNGTPAAKAVQARPTRRRKLESGKAFPHATVADSRGGKSTVYAASPYQYLSAWDERLASSGASRNANKSQTRAPEVPHFLRRNPLYLFERMRHQKRHKMA